VNPSPLESWREEKQSAWLYRQLAESEPEARMRQLFLVLADAADEQAGLVARELEGALPPFRPSLRARLVVRLARRHGPRRVSGMLAALKVRGLSAYHAVPGAASGVPDSGAGGWAGEAGHPAPTRVEEIGARHRRAGGGNLRAAVFGINDGLVSNTGLVLGVAGAGAGVREVLLAGIAGLLAGAFSMASGEYVSVRSQRELYERQIGEERAELDRYPEAEAEELALIYAARGVPLEQARQMTRQLVRDKEHALATLSREELGINPDDLGSPWGAAIYSFLSFAGGASLPVLPFLLGGAGRALPIAIALAGVALFAVGAVLTMFSGKSALLGGLRMLALGALAGGATYLIGHVLGVSLA
jgi:vacuolar iron transporter family protein